MAKKVTFKKPYVQSQEEMYWVGEAAIASIGVVVLSTCYMGLGFFLVPFAVRGWIFAKRVRQKKPLESSFVIGGLKIPMNKITLFLSYAVLCIPIRIFIPIFWDGGPMAIFLFSAVLMIAIGWACTLGWPEVPNEEITVMAEE